MLFSAKVIILKQSKKLTLLNKKEILEEIGLQYKMRRLELGFKAVEIAEKMGISRQLLSNFERGKSNNLILAIMYEEVLDYEDDQQRAKQRAEPPEQFSQ